VNEAAGTLPVCYNENSSPIGVSAHKWVCSKPERKWWNWQTHHLEGVAPKGVGVQIPPSAPRFERIAQREMLLIFITLVHVIVCMVLIVVVLLQHGKSADIAATFGGMGSQTAFGPRGTATVFSRLTTWCAIIFMVTSMALTYLSSRRGSSSVLDNVQTPANQSQPKK
jgi:preprotein translocase subunit SecG